MIKISTLLKNSSKKGSFQSKNARSRPQTPPVNKGGRSPCFLPISFRLLYPLPKVGERRAGGYPCPWR